MDNEYIQLVFNNISEILGNKKIGIIVLTDILQERQIAVICDEMTKEAISIRTKKMVDTSNELAEALIKVMEWNGIDDCEVVMEDVKDEQYSTFIHERKSNKKTPVKASHGILLSLITGCPIMMRRGLMDKQSNSFMGKSEKLSVPINVLSESMLKESLERAIEEENYEMASKLNKELNRRKKNQE